MRIIFFAGKGGVGKTSVAAATGIRAAELGYKTVVMSLDVAHSLSDIFDLQKHLLDQNRGKPFKIQDTLWIQELDVQEEIKSNWGDIHKYLSALLNTTGLDEILAEELAILPGMEEVSLLLHLNRYVKKKRFDVIILDCAPTGESLRFISLPTTLEWYMKKLFKLERTLVKYARPVAKRFYDVPLPGDDYFEAIAHLFEGLKGVDQIMADHSITSARLVTNPEKVVLKETQRAFMYFTLHRINIDAVIMNRILPDQVLDTFFVDWLKSQRKHLKKAEEYFAPVPVFPVSLFREEVVGFNRLKLLGDQLYQGRNPLECFFAEPPFTLTKQDERYQLHIKLPFVMKQDVDLNKFSNELVVRIGSYKRHFLLPRQVAASEVVKAILENQRLCILFEGDGDGKRKG